MVYKIDNIIAFGIFSEVPEIATGNLGEFLTNGPDLGPQEIYDQVTPSTAETAFIKQLETVLKAFNLTPIAPFRPIEDSGAKSSCTQGGSCTCNSEISHSFV